MEFTGNYNRCTSCDHIYDFEDACPQCGCDFIQDLNASEVREFIICLHDDEIERVCDMLRLHAD